MIRLFQRGRRLVTALDVFVSVVTSVGVGVGVLLLGYLYNGRLQRRLQRDTTNYEAKLVAYREVNRSATHVINVLAGLRRVHAIRDGAPPTEEDLFDLAWETGLARDSEAFLETDVTSRVAQDLREASKEGGSELQHWAPAARVSLISVYSRAMAHHLSAMEVQIAQANLVSRSKVVEAALGRFERRVTEYSRYTTERAGSGLPSPDDLTTETNELVAEWQRLGVAMKRELRETL